MVNDVLNIKDTIIVSNVVSTATSNVTTLSVDILDSDFGGGVGCSDSTVFVPNITVFDSDIGAYMFKFESCNVTNHAFKLKNSEIDGSMFKSEDSMVDIINSNFSETMLNLTNGEFKNDLLQMSDIMGD